jgi:Cof subfamily protein (haloacid dehalogenase superfamily)
MKIKLLALDMDGTMLKSKHELDPLVADRISQAIKKGVKVVLATGRVYPSAKFYAKQLNTKGAIISCNGAYIKDYQSDAIIDKKAIKRESFKAVLDLLGKFEVSYQMFGNNTYYALEENEVSRKYIDWNKTQSQEDRIDIKIIDDPYVLLEKDIEIYKVLLNHRKINQEKFLKIRMSIDAIEDIYTIRSMPDSIDIINDKVNKGDGLKSVCRYYDIDLESTMAIGDNENDLEMIQYSKIGVAMGNAEEYIKQAADYTTLSNIENGVAAAIEKFIL